MGLMDLETERPSSEGRQSRFGWALATVLIVFILALLAAFVFYRLETWPQRSIGSGVAGLERIGREARDQFVRLAQLQPRVTVNNRVYLEQKTSVAELAVISRRVAVEHNLAILKRQRFPEVVIAEGDTVEIVNFVGGG